MEIRIKSCKPEEAEGLTVLIDVIHSSSTIVQLLDSGIEKLIPLAENQDIQPFKEQGYLVFGERFSTAFKKSEYLNSPLVAETLDLKGKKAVIKTDNGTKAVLAAKNASEILIGCFLNARALLEYVKSKNPKSVDLIPVGRHRKQAIEDELFAEYFKNFLEGKEMDFDGCKNKIFKNWRNIIRLIFLGQHTNSCFKLNTCTTVPLFKGGELVPIKTR